MYDHHDAYDEFEDERSDTAAPSVAASFTTTAGSKGSSPAMNLEAVTVELKRIYGVHTAASLKFPLESLSRTARDKRFLVGVPSTSSPEEIGKTLVKEIEEVFTVLGPAFCAVTNNNINMDAARSHSVENMTVLGDRIEELNLIIGTVMITPVWADTEHSITTATMTLKKLYLDTYPDPASRTPAIKDEQKNKLFQASIELQLKYNAKVAHNDATVAAINKAKSDLVPVNKAHQWEQIFGVILQILTDCQTSLTNNIKNALNTGKHESIKTALKGMALLSTTASGRPIQIANPFDNNHLCGIVAILKEKYYSSNFGNFLRSLDDLFSFSMTLFECDNDPQKSINKHIQMASEWERRDLFKQLTPDMLLSASLVASMHAESALRKEVAKELSDFLRRLERDPKLHKSDKPIYEFIINLVATIESNKQLSGQHSTSAPKQQPQQQQQQQPGRNPRRDTEQAALATDSNGKLYTAEVFRSQNVVSGVNQHGKSVPYVAVRKQSSICNRCYPESGIASPCRTPPCYATQCDNCKFFGHVKKNCLHAAAPVSKST